MRDDCPPYTHSAARKSTSVLFVQNWFRRLVDHASQAPLLRQALDKLQKYEHPWMNHDRLHDWATNKYGTTWKFDPLTHHTSEILADVRTEHIDLADELQKLWAGDELTGTVYSSYRNRARELARICGETMNHDPGSTDMQIIERADLQDGFQILQLMKEATILYIERDCSSDFVDQDAELKKIKHQFVIAGVHTYVQAYKRRRHNLPFKNSALSFDKNSGSKACFRSM